MASTRSDSTPINPASQGLKAALGGTITPADHIYVGMNYSYVFAGGQVLGQDLASFTILPSQRGSITGLSFDATAGVVTWSGSGGPYEFVAAGTEVHAQVIVDMGGPGKLAYTGAAMTITLLEPRRGVSSFGSLHVVTSCLATGGDTLLAEGAASSALVQASGDAIVRLNRDVTTAEAIANGRVLIDSLTCTPGTLIPKGGSFEFKQCGTISAIGVSGEMPSGVLDFSQITQPITVSAHYESPALRIRLPRGRPSMVTFSSPNISHGVSPREYV